MNVVCCDACLAPIQNGQRVFAFRTHWFYTWPPSMLPANEGDIVLHTKAECIQKWVNQTDSIWVRPL